MDRAQAMHCSAGRTRLASCYGVIFTLAVMALATPPDAHAQPPNLGDLKTDLLAYQRYGGYERELAAVASQAQAYLDAHAADFAQTAMVLDIDETSLSNWIEIEADDFGFIPGGDCSHLPDGPCGALAWDNLAQATAIPPILALYNDAKSRHVAVFFITGRHEVERAATEKTLRLAGYTDWNALIMEPDGLKPPSAKDFKAPERAKIEARGYHILVNVGDQPSDLAGDLAGGHASRAFLLPNPFYRIP
jgi:predicted secreted acid phosphatase